MEVILKKNVAGLGPAGSVHKVKDGFANNFLIRSGAAVPVTESNMTLVQKEKERSALKLEKAKKTAEELKARLAQLSITLPVLTQEKDKLYGSISAVEIQKALKEEGIELDKNAIRLDEPIKSLGIYQIPIELHPEVQAELKIWVVKK